jgi:hypothetical protein
MAVLYGAEKTLISFAVVENKNVIVHIAVRLPTPGPSKDGLFCLINAWLSSIARVQSNHLQAFS